MNNHQPYISPHAQILVLNFRAATRHLWRLMNLLAGIHTPHRNAPCYWHVSPNGDGAHLRTIVHCSLYIVYCPTYTFSAKEKDSETGLSYFGSRYYSSDLSIWLSVDPMSDKYPSLSPFVYCANNPVKVVDPDGEEWETPEDIDFANSLISHAKSIQKNYETSSFEYQLLQEGIDGLINMGADENACYTFNKSQTYEGYVSLKDNGTISINYLDIDNEPDSKLGSAWHEAYHLTRRNNWLKHTPEQRENASTKIWSFSTEKKLGNNNRPNEEYITYKSQLIFCPNSMPKNDGVRISNDDEIKSYIRKHYSVRDDHIFEFPK